MSDSLKQNYKNIADAIRAKTGENGLMKPTEMPGKIETIETGIEPTGSISITANGNNIDVTNYASANVNVPSYPEPTGIAWIYENGYSDVKNYAQARVLVNTSQTVDQYSLESVAAVSRLIVDNSIYNYTYALWCPDPDYIDNPSKSLEAYCQWAWDHGYGVSDLDANVNIHRVPGGYESIPNYHDSNCIIIGALCNSNFSGNTPWSITLHMTYTGYDGSYTEDELANAWYQFFSGSNISVYDMSGSWVGYVNDISVEVHCSGES